MIYFGANINSIIIIISLSLLYIYNDKSNDIIKYVMDYHESSFIQDSSISNMAGDGAIAYCGANCGYSNCSIGVVEGCEWYGCVSNRNNCTCGCACGPMLEVEGPNGPVVIQGPAIQGLVYESCIPT